MNPDSDMYRDVMTCLENLGGCFVLVHDTYGDDWELSFWDRET